MVRPTSKTHTLPIPFPMYIIKLIVDLLSMIPSEFHISPPSGYHHKINLNQTTINFLNNIDQNTFVSLFSAAVFLDNILTRVLGAYIAQHLLSCKHFQDIQRDFKFTQTNLFSPLYMNIASTYGVEFEVEKESSGWTKNHMGDLINSDGKCFDCSSKRLIDQIIKNATKQPLLAD